MSDQAPLARSLKRLFMDERMMGQRFHMTAGEKISSYDPRHHDPYYPTQLLPPATPALLDAINRRDAGAVVGMFNDTIRQGFVSTEHERQLGALVRLGGIVWAREMQQIMAHGRADYLDGFISRVSENRELESLREENSHRAKAFLATHDLEDLNLPFGMAEKIRELLEEGWLNPTNVEDRLQHHQIEELTEDVEAIDHDRQAVQSNLLGRTHNIAS